MKNYMTYAMIAVLTMASSTVFADNFQFSTKKFSYQVPKKVVNLCAKKIKEAQEKDNPKIACMEVDIDLLTSNYAWVNEAVNKQYQNKQQFLTSLNEQADDVYLALQNKNSQYQYYELSKELSLVGISQNLLQIKSENFEYMGGAHGMPQKLFYTFDIKQQKQLKVADILTRSDKKVFLESLAIQALKRELISKYQEMDMEFTEQRWRDYIRNQDFQLTNNFYFTPTGLNFSYEPYALESYAMGFFTLKLHKKDLQGIVKDEYLNQSFPTFVEDE